MTETRLPEELEEQAMRYALGVLDPDDRRAFLVRLQGESDLLRQAVTGYQAVTDALATTVIPVSPPVAIRERLVNNIALEAARESEQFERAANTLALGAVPVKPRDLVRERLLSRIEGHSAERLEATDSMPMRSAESLLVGGGNELETARRLSQEGGLFSDWPRFCWTAIVNFLRTLAIRSMTSERVRYWKAKITFQQPTKGLTFIGASEGTWRGIAPGVTAKVLSFDPVSCRTTTLLRFASGTSYAPHRHTAVEELLVLEGGCSIAGHEMTVGDYHRAEAGTVHHDTSTDDGCLLLVISSPQNEILR